MSYWTTVFTRIRRRPPSCEVIYLPKEEAEDYMFVYFTRAEDFLEWCVVWIGILLGRNKLTASHVCFSLTDNDNKVTQIEATYDGVEVYHNENPLRDVILGVAVPIVKEVCYTRWEYTLMTIMLMELRVQRLDLIRWLLKLPVNFSCTSFVNYLLHCDNTHLDPDILLENIIQRNQETRSKLNGKKDM